MESMGDLAKRIRGDMPQGLTTRHRGKVVSFSAGVVNIYLDGDTTSTIPARYFGHYSPTIDDTVEVLIDSTDILVLGVLSTQLVGSLQRNIVDALGLVDNLASVYVSSGTRTITDATGLSDTVFVETITVVAENHQRTITDTLVVQEPASVSGASIFYSGEDDIGAADSSSAELLTEVAQRIITDSLGTTDLNDTYLVGSSFLTTDGLGLTHEGAYTVVAGAATDYRLGLTDEVSYMIGP
jgi:hypothetical protein